MRLRFHIFCLLALLLANPCFIKAQSRLPLGSLGKLLEETSGIPVRATQGLLDTLQVSMYETTGNPLEILQKALEGTGYSALFYDGALIVMPGEAPQTQLPRDFFLTQREAVAIQGMNAEDDILQVAWSENKLYEVGIRGGSQQKTVTLKGTVSNFKTEEPLAGVTLFIEDPWIGTTTDKDGNYTIELPAGRQDLRLRAVGLNDTYRQLMLYQDGRLDISMDEKVIDLEEVAITASRLENVRSTTMGVTRLKMNQIKNIPTSFGESDILKVVMTLPGVKSAGEVSTGLNVRGGASDQNLILFNSGTVFNPTHMFGLFSVFNSDLVSDMELYKSSIPTKYGGRISSVLDINTKSGNQEKIKGSASIGILTSGLAVDGPLGKKTTFILGGRLTYSDWLLRKLPQKSGYSDGNAGFWDANLGLEHRFDEKNHLKFSAYVSSDRFRFNEQQRYNYQNFSASLRYMHAYDANHTGYFTIGVDRYQSTVIDETDILSGFKLNYDVNQAYAKADFSHLVGDHHTLSYGASANYYLLNPGKKTPSEGSYIAADQLESEKALEAALYLSDNWEISEKLSLDMGLRWNLYGALGPKETYIYEKGQLPSINNIKDIKTKKGVTKFYQGPEIRLSARYEIMDGLSVKASFNNMRQNIHKISNTTIMSPTDTWKLSDLNIKPQKGRQVSLGVYKNFDDINLETSLEGYYKTMDDYLDYRSGAVLAMNHHIETDVLPSQGRSYGVELLIRRAAGNLNGWISYTWSRTQLRQNDPRIDLPVNGGQWYAADFDRPHDVKVVANYKFSKRFSMSLNADYSTGRPVSLPTSKYIYAGGEYVYFSQRNHYRIPDNFRLDYSINIEPSHHLTNLTHTSLQIGVYNLTGRKNVYSVYYTMEKGKLNGYKLAIFGLPIPYASLNIKF